MLLPNKWNDYAMQYLKLAESKLLKEKKLDNSEILPIIYVARHYVELRLKMIRKISKVLNGGKAKNVEGHNLESLWNGFVLLIEQVLKNNNLFDTKTQDGLYNIGEFIKSQTGWDDDSKHYAIHLI